MKTILLLWVFTMAFAGSKTVYKDGVLSAGSEQKLGGGLGDVGFGGGGFGGGGFGGGGFGGSSWTRPEIPSVSVSVEETYEKLTYGTLDFYCMDKTVESDNPNNDPYEVLDAYGKIADYIANEGQRVTDPFLVFRDDSVTNVVYTVCVYPDQINRDDSEYSGTESAKSQESQIQKKSITLGDVLVRIFETRQYSWNTFKTEAERIQLVSADQANYDATKFVAAIAGNPGFTIDRRVWVLSKSAGIN